MILSFTVYIPENIKTPVADIGDEGFYDDKLKIFILPDTYMQAV